MGAFHRQLVVLWLVWLLGCYWSVCCAVMFLFCDASVVYCVLCVLARCTNSLCAQSLEKVRTLFQVIVRGGTLLNHESGKPLTTASVADDVVHVG